MKSIVLFLSFSLLLLTACQKEAALIGTPVDLTTLEPSLSFEINGTSYNLEPSSVSKIANGGFPVEYQSFGEGGRNLNAYTLNTIFTTEDESLMPVLTWHKSLSKDEHKELKKASNKGYASIEEFDAFHNLDNFQYASATGVYDRAFIEKMQTEQLDYYTIEFWEDPFKTADSKHWVVLESTITIDAQGATQEVVHNGQSGFLKEVELSFDMLISDGTQTLQLTNGKATSFLHAWRSR